MTFKIDVKAWCWRFLPDLQGIVPADATNTTLPKDDLGKIPGYLRNDIGMWVASAGSFAERFMTMEGIEEIIRTGAALGIQGRNWPGLDIDIDDDFDTVQAICDLAATMLGLAPGRFRENSTRVLLMYAGKGHRKRRMEIRRRGGRLDGTEAIGAVEWLATGQYYNLSGLHRSGVYYEWSDPPPYEKLCAIPEVSVADVDAFWAALRRLLEHASWTVKEGRGGAGALAAGPRKAIGDPSLAAPDPEMVLQALEAWQAERLDGRDAAVRFLAGIKGALGEHHELFRIDVLEWWRKHPDAIDDAYFDRIWDSITDAELGWSWLDQATGFTVSVEQDFKDEPNQVGTRAPNPREEAIEKMRKCYRYIRQQDVFIDMETCELLTRKAFDSRNTLVELSGKSGPKAAHNVFINHPDCGKSRSLTYWPGKDRIVDDMVNTWRPSRLVPVEGDPGIWLDHVAEMFPNPGEREHFLDWCAFVLQNPGKKISHAMVLHTTKHGTGKDTMLSPLCAGVGEDNFRLTSPEALISDFTKYLMAQVVYIPEMRNFEKGSTYLKLKQLIASPPKTVSVRLMYQDAFEIPNFQNYVFTSNSADAIALEQGDRRFWVPTCVGHPKEDTEYYDRIWWFYDFQKGREIVVGYLLKRDLSNFRPGDAPMSDAKQDMIDLATPPGVHFLRTMFTEDGVFASRDLLTTFEVRERLADTWGQPAVKDIHVAQVLGEMGFRTIPGKYRIEGQARKVWTKLKDPTGLAQSDIGVAQRWKRDRDGK